MSNEYCSKKKMSNDFITTTCAIGKAQKPYFNRLEYDHSCLLFPKSKKKKKNPKR